MGRSHHQPIYGRTRWAPLTKSFKEKAARMPLLFTTCTSFVRPTGLGMRTRSCKRSCGGTRRFKSTTGKRRCGRTHGISEGVGKRRRRVAREPRIAHSCPRIQIFGCSHWPSGFRGGLSGQEDERTRTPFRANPGNGRPPKRMVGPSVLRNTTSQLLVEVRSPRVGPPVCRQSRRQHVGVSRKVDWSPSSVRTFTGGGVFAVLAWGVGSDQCDEGLQSCALGQLDRFPRHEPEKAPRSCTHHRGEPHP